MNFPTGGAGATYLNLFCRGLKFNGSSISLFLLKGHAFGNFVSKEKRKNISQDGIPYTYLGFTQRPKNKFLKIVEELLSLFRLILLLFTLLGKRKSVNLLVLTSEIQYTLPIHFFTRLFGIKRSGFVAEIIDISEYGNSFFGKITRWGHSFSFRHLNKRADKLVLFSHYLKNEYLNMGYNEKSILVQPNLTDFDFWAPPPDAEIKYTIGYSGAPYLKDGLYDLFAAISILQKMNIHVTLLIIGDVIFGKSLIPGLKSECKKFGVAEKVTFTGLVESADVKKYLSQCSILAITRPSTTQTKAGFPTKLGEYFASKRPVLATNFGDMDKYFTDGKDILMAECGNPESIALKIKWMLTNISELEVISKKGYERSFQLLEYKNSVTRMDNFLRFT